MNITLYDNYEFETFYGDVYGNGTRNAVLGYMWGDSADAFIESGVLTSSKAENKSFNSSSFMCEHLLQFVSSA